MTGTFQLRFRRIRIFLLILFVLFLSGCSLFNPTLPKNAIIAGVPVGGLNKEEVISVLESSVQDAYLSKTLTVTLNQHTLSLTPEQTKVTLDVPALADFIFSQRPLPNSVDITPFLSLQEQTVRKLIREVKLAYFSSVFEESSYQISGQRPVLTGTTPEDGAQTLILKIGVPSFSLDENDLYQEILNCYKNNRFILNFDVPITLPQTLDLKMIYSQHCVEPVDAVMDKTTFEISDHSYGYVFDLEVAKSQVNSAEYGDILQIPFHAVAPTVTQEDLSSILYRDVLGSYTAHASSQWGRNINLKLSCEAINGIVLMPGEVFSYNPALGERTPERGWQEADGYVGTQTVKEYGGGICQASSCLYLSAMLADMEIVYRINHGFISSYMPFGMDATVSWGGPEFLFRNNSEYPIRIEASASGGSVTVSLIGTDTKDYYVKMEYEILKTDPYETVEQEFPPDNPEGYKDGDVVITPYTGYEIVTYRCKYSKATNELISRKKEALSIYNRRDEVICRIPEPETTDPPETVPETEPSEPQIENSNS